MENQQINKSAGVLRKFLYQKNYSSIDIEVLIQIILFSAEQMRHLEGLTVQSLLNYLISINILHNKKKPSHKRGLVIIKNFISTIPVHNQRFSYTLDQRQQV